MQLGVGFPEASVSVLRMQHAALSRQEGALVLASTQKSPAFTEVTMATQRFFGPGGGAARQDVLAAADVDEPFGSDEDQEACAAYRKAEKQEMRQRMGNGIPKKSSGK